MNHGKNTCNQLKAIRQQIADANGIEYCPHECTFEGECIGTCSACEGEMRYIESELRRRQRLGKKIAVVGLAMGLSATPALAQEPAATIPEECINELDGDVYTEVEIPEVLEVVEEDDEEEPFLGIIVEQMPEFPGGELALRKYIADNIRYPDEPGGEDIEGVVYVRFKVDTLGNVGDVIVVRGLHPLFDAEAVRVVKSFPRFEPARQRGKAVGTTLTVPVKFVRSNDNSPKKSKKNKQK
ncbi:MAG: energy transducer TonB [Bacteroidales bacterium]|nr:energy transducer TonB [Bacteroidales bacterium]